MEVRQDERIVLTVEGTARLLGIGRSLAWRLVAEGELPEILGLEWADADLKRGEIVVRRHFGRDRRFGEPRSARGRRRIGIPASAITALQEHKRIQTEEAAFAGADWSERNLVFTTLTGAPLIGQTVTTAFKVLLKRAGLPDVRFHDLRHTHATLLFSQGVHPKVVQERLGHSQISVTLDIYSRVQPGMDRDAADRFDTLLD